MLAGLAGLFHPQGQVIFIVLHRHLSGSFSDERALEPRLQHQRLSLAPQSNDRKDFSEKSIATTRPVAAWATAQAATPLLIRRTWPAQRIPDVRR